MKAEIFTDILNAEFYTGVPDSQLKPLCDYLMQKYGISKQHIIAANEGNAVALATGYFLSTGKIPVVYMQNSGIGNAVNPMASLLNEKVYAIPSIFVVGWRGEPGVSDEPQHIYQGEITLELLELMGISTYVVDKNTTKEDLSEQMIKFTALLQEGKSVAFVIKKGALEYQQSIDYQNDYKLNREDILSEIVEVAQEDIIVSTTGKTSRELFEIRERRKQTHEYDFLTVGSMGHCSSIALSIALYKSDKKVWCIDGDGAALMHMGAMAVIGTANPANYVHVLMNNGAHESVGGMPTVANEVDLRGIAKSCGYKNVFLIEEGTDVRQILKEAKKCTGLTFIEVRVSIQSRKDLGRPTVTALENRMNFMNYLLKRL